MGVITGDTGNSITIKAYLTPYGKEKFYRGAWEVSSFALHDDGINYNSEDLLVQNEVPAIAGNLGVNGSLNITTTNDPVPFSNRNSKIIFDRSTAQTLRPVEAGSSTVVTTKDRVGFTVADYTNLTENIVDRTDIMDSKSNWFAALGLPITDSDQLVFDELTSTNNGFKDTAVEGINQDSVLFIGINNELFSSQIVGHSVKLDLTSPVYGPMSLYTTYQKTSASRKTQDANYRDKALNTAVIGKGNIAFLFSDDIQKPNSDASKSWGTNFGVQKPFSVNGGSGLKEFYNYEDNADLSQVKDTAVGFVNLNSGFAVITDQSIVSAYTATTATTVEFDTVVTETKVVVTCLVPRQTNRGSSNPTWSGSGALRLNGLTLYDTQGRAVAVSTFDKHINLTQGAFAAFSVEVVT